MNPICGCTLELWLIWKWNDFYTGQVKKLLYSAKYSDFLAFTTYDIANIIGDGSQLKGQWSQTASWNRPLKNKVWEKSPTDLAM